MTFVLSVIGRRHIWLLADQRLSVGTTTRRDNACKVTVLETSDAVALLGYSGLGETGRGRIEPSTWMAKVLNGRGWPLGPSLDVLASAMATQFPPHLKPRLAASEQFQHTVLVPAFLNKKPTLFAIGFCYSPGQPQPIARSIRLRKESYANGDIPPSIFGTGSGLTSLLKNQKNVQAGDDMYIITGDVGPWQRELLRLVAAADKGRIHPKSVADRLAALNHEVSGLDRGTGPNCVVVWRDYPSGGAHQYYSGTKETNGPSIPTVLNGRYMTPIFDLMMDAFGKHMEKIKPSEDVDAAGWHQEIAKVNEIIKTFPTTPDEELK